MTHFLVGLFIGLILSSFFRRMSPEIDPEELSDWKKEVKRQMWLGRAHWMEDLRIEHGEDFFKKFLAFLRQYQAEKFGGEQIQKQQPQSDSSNWKPAQTGDMEYKGERVGDLEYNINYRHKSTPSPLDKWRNESLQINSNE